MGVSQCQLKKPNSLLFSKRNDIHPFDDVTPVHFLSQKNDASLLVVGTHSKKRPSNLTFVRLFNHEVLDMMELGVSNWKPMSAFTGSKAALGMKPLMIFSGDIFDQREDYSKLKNMLLDFFRGEEVEKISLNGLEYVISVTAEPYEPPRLMGRIFFRVFTVALKKSGVKLPRVELQEMGPSMDLTIRRSRFASQELMKFATKVPKELKVGCWLLGGSRRVFRFGTGTELNCFAFLFSLSQETKVKNISEDVVGDKFGRIHMKQQPLAELQTRKMKGLKRKPEGDVDAVAKKSKKKKVKAGGGDD